MRSTAQGRTATRACSEQTCHRVPPRTPHNRVLRMKSVMRSSALPVQPKNIPVQRYRGKLFYRLLQQAVQTGPVPGSELKKGVRSGPERRPRRR